MNDVEMLGILHSHSEHSFTSANTVLILESLGKY